MYQHLNGLILRKVTRADLDLLLALRGDGWVGFHRTLLLNADDQARWYEGLGRDEVVLVAERVVSYGDRAGAVQALASDERAGVFNARLDRDNRTAEVSWGVFRQHRGHGLGSKLVQAGVDFCFEMHDLHRVSCEILSTNVRSQRAAEKAGFRVEGRKVEAVYRLDQRIDSIVYGLLRPAWRSQGPVPRNKAEILPKGDK